MRACVGCARNLCRRSAAGLPLRAPLPPPTPLAPSRATSPTHPPTPPALPPSPVEASFNEQLGMAGRELLEEGVARLVDDANRLEPFFLNMAGGQE